MYGSWNKRQVRQSFAFLGHFLPSWQPKKSKFWKNKTNTSWYHFTFVYQKWQLYDVWFLKYGVQQTEFFVFWTIFYHFAPLTTCKIKFFWKNEKKTWIYYHFTHVYHKWKIYDVWFLRYGAQQTEFFIILKFFLYWTIFCPLPSLLPPRNSSENQNFEKMKKLLGDIIVHTIVP